MYGIPVIPDTYKCADSITGGRIIPPVEATASTAPADEMDIYFFYQWYVKTPVLATLAQRSVMEPTSPLAIIAPCAGPDRVFLLMQRQFFKKIPQPRLRKHASKIMNKTRNVADTSRMVPYAPVNLLSWRR
jgi:hypothetical protein